MPSRCPNCAASITAADAFCAACGTRLLRSPAPPEDATIAGGSAATLTGDSPSSETVFARPIAASPGDTELAAPTHVGPPPNDETTVVGHTPADDATYVGRAPADDATYVGRVPAEDATYIGRAPADDATFVGRASDDATFVGRPALDAPTIAAGSGAEPPTVAPRAVRPPTASRVVGSPSDHLKPGEEFGTRYQIIKLLGVGGMGAVYQAWDAELGVAVAIKTIRPGVGTDASAAVDAERRFKRELLLARQVTHPNVVRIYDLGEIDGTKYITMSYVEGQDLATLLAADGKLAVDRALDIMRQVVSGMRAAHTAGIVHRDLKPANIMIDGSQALIMDFGIARSVTGPADPGLAPSAPAPTTSGHSPGTTGLHQATSALTVAGSVMGTLDYMAPEQATGQPVDQRADIYALGLIFYDIILGRAARPRTGNPFADFKQRLAEPLKSPKTIDPAVPEAVDAIIARCLQPDPEARYQTSDELGEALDALDEHGNLRPIPVPVKPRSNWVLAAAGFLMIVAAVGSWFLGRQGATPVEERPPLPVLIANFDNRTGDAVFDGALEQVLKLGVEGASFVTAYPREAAARIARELAPGTVTGRRTCAPGRRARRSAGGAGRHDRAARFGLSHHGARPRRHDRRRDRVGVSGRGQQGPGSRSGGRSRHRPAPCPW